MPKNVSQRKDAKKWPMDANFQTPASTGRKVEMARANAVLCWNTKGKRYLGICHYLCVIVG